MALEAFGWLVDHCCPQLSFGLSEKRRRQNDATIQDMLKLNNKIRSAESTECKLKIRSIPIHHPTFMGVHGAARVNVEGGASQQTHVILAVQRCATEQKVPVSILSWSSKKIKRVVRSSLAAETSSMATCVEQLDWMKILWSQMTTAELFLGQLRGCFAKQRALLVTDCKSLYHAIHKERGRSFINGQVTCD